MSEKLLRSLISISCAILFLVASDCGLFRPAVPQPAFDVLKPGSEVRIMGFTVAGQKMVVEEGKTGETRDGDVIVSDEFMARVVLLKQEIRRLRKTAGETW